ncbi:Pentatricopeptide repeat-containing protein [Porphyridium purpureum]|uniref:Pentatricopeptide repeat-containing protein n=1 Tax=Porphyridium purpureum TaxID=35688 RepID=A0A5J4YXI9_PORPP|nr:Pentatricopeptide repeat-containing protein [Porphyridium purpureum]|eukprot:POR8266..scf209_3
MLGLGFVGAPDILVSVSRKWQKVEDASRCRLGAGQTRCEQAVGRRRRPHGYRYGRVHSSSSTRHLTLWDTQPGHVRWSQVPVSGEDGAAVATTQADSNAKVDVEPLRVALRRAVECGHIEAAMRSFERLIQVSPSGVHVITCNKLVNMLSSSGRVDLAIVVYELMKIHGVAPTVVTYSTMLAGIGRRGRVRISTSASGQQSSTSPGNASRSASGSPSRRLDFSTRSSEHLCARDDDLHFLSQIEEEPLSVASRLAWQLFREMALDQRLEPDVILMNSLISAFARSGDLDFAIIALGLMRNFRISPNVRTFNTILSTFAHERFVGKKNEAARDAMKQMQRPSYDAYSRTISQLMNRKSLKRLARDRERQTGKKENVPQATASGECSRTVLVENHVTQVLDLMAVHGIEPNLITYSTLTDIFGRLGNIDMALLYFNTIEQKGLVANEIVYSTMISALARKGMLNAAFGLLDRWKAQSVESLARSAPNVQTYTSLIDACGKANKLEKMFEMFEIMCEDGVLPNAHTYTCMIDAVGKAGDFELALSLFSSMRGAGIEPSEVTYTALLQASSRATDLDEAYEMFLEATTELGGRMPRDPSLYYQLVHVFGKGNEMERAFAVFECMKSIGVEPDHITLETLLSSAGKGRSFEQAMDVFREMRSRGFVPREESFRTLLAVCGMSGELVTAFLVFTEMKRAGLPLNTAYESLLEACSSANDIEAALCVFDDMRLEGVQPSAEAYSRLLQAATTNSAKFDQARFSLSKSSAGQGRELDLDRGASLAGMECAAPEDTPQGGQDASLDNTDVANSNLVRVFLLFREMESSGLDPDIVAYNALMQCCAVAGDSHHGLAVLASMQAKGIEPDVVTYTALMKACFMTSEVEGAFDVLEAMRRAGVQPTCFTFVTMIQGCARCGQFDRVKHLADDMTSEYGVEPDDSVYTAMIRAQCKLGYLFGAVETLKQMKDRKMVPPVSLLRRIAALAEQQMQHVVARKIMDAVALFERKNSRNAYQH